MQWQAMGGNADQNVLRWMGHVPTGAGWRGAAPCAMAAQTIVLAVTAAPQPALYVGSYLLLACQQAGGGNK